MALAQTAKFSELVLEVEWTPSSGTYTAVCGLIDVSISRTANTDTAEVPDCDNEDLPLKVEKAVRSIETTISGTGVWALQSHENLLDWFYSGGLRNVRIRNVKAQNDGVTGDTTIESGAALLTGLNNSRSKGQKVTAEVELAIDGDMARTAK
jgi:hypothetical protein